MCGLVAFVENSDLAFKKKKGHDNEEQTYLSQVKHTSIRMMKGSHAKRHSGGDAQEFPRPERLSSTKRPKLHAMLLHREMSGEDTQNLFEMTWKQRLAEFRRVVMDPINLDDMPDLIVLDDKGVVVRLLNQASSSYRPTITLKWDSEGFTATADRLFSTVEMDLVNTALGPQFDHDDKRGGSLFAAVDKTPTLRFNRVTRRRHLVALAAPFRVMAGIVFRDAWLMHLISAQPRLLWESRIFEMVAIDSEAKTFTTIWIRVATDHTILDVFVFPPVEQSEGRVHISLNPTSPKAMWLQRVQRLLGLTPQRERVEIHPYQTYADVARVMHALRVLLLP